MRKIRNILMLAVLAILFIAYPGLRKAEAAYDAVIMDAADDLTSDEEDKLTKGIMKELTELTNVYFVTLNHNPFTASEGDSECQKIYCENLYETLFGKDEYVNCVIVLVDEENGWCYTYMNGEIGEKIDDSDQELFTDSAMDKINEDDYYSFAQIVFNNVHAILVDGTERVQYRVDEISDDSTGYKGYIMDEAFLLSDDEKGSLLEDSIKPLLAYTNVCAVTINNNPYGYSTSSTIHEKEYCSALYDRYFEASGSEYENAVIFLIDMDTRWIYIYREGEIKSQISEDICDIVTDNIYTYASDKKYDKCFSEGIAQLVSVMEGKPIERTMMFVCNIFIALAIGFVLTYLYASSVSKSHSASASEMMKDVVRHFDVSEPEVKYVSTTKVYNPPSSSSSGGSHSGGGGGSHGGGGGHRF